MRTRIVAVVVSLIPATVSAQVGILHSAREHAAGVAAAMIDISGTLRPSNDWMVDEPVVDDFTDEVGQAAALWGRNHRLVLIVACNAGTVANIAVGGLAGGSFMGRATTPNVLFQDGGVDIRWGGGLAESQEWIDGDLVLATSGSSMADFLDRASRENRLRMRASVVRNRVIQDEFDLVNLEVTPLTVSTLSGARDGLSCARGSADPVQAQREIEQRQQERRDQERRAQAAQEQREQEQQAEQARFLANIPNTPITDGLTGPIAAGSAGIRTPVGYALALFPGVGAAQLSRARRSGQYVIVCGSAGLADNGGIVLRSCSLTE